MSTEFRLQLNSSAKKIFQNIKKGKSKSADSMQKVNRTLIKTENNEKMDCSQLILKEEVEIGAIKRRIVFFILSFEKQ